MALKDTMKHMTDLLGQITRDLTKSDRGNKAASQRVRTATVKLEKVAKLYRKESIKGEKSTKGNKKAKPAKKAAKKSAKKAAPKAHAKKATSKARGMTFKKRATAKLPTRRAGH